LGSISAPFGEPASRFTSAIERSENGRRKILGGTVGARLKEVINVYKNACATLGNFCVDEAGWDQFQLLLVNQPVVLLVQLNVRENGRR
jgi:hypothetical protein